MIAQHYGFFHVFAPYHFIGFVSLYFVVGRILAFRYTCNVSMLYENSIQLQFFGINTWILITVLSTFVLPSLKALVLFEVSFSI